MCDWGITVHVYANGTVIVNAFTVTGTTSPVIVNVYTNGSVYTNGCYRPDALAVCRAHLGLSVDFLLLWYSVLFSVESLSLYYLLVIS